MNQRHIELADQVVSTFRSNLDSQLRERIGQAGFEHLHVLICEALSEELGTVAGRVEALLTDLRAEIEKPEIEL